MESVSTLLEGERNYFSETYNVSEEADFMSHLLGNFSNNLPKPSSTFEDSSSSSSSAFWSPSISMPCFQDTYTDNNTLLFPTSSGESYPSMGSSKGNSVIPCFSKKRSFSFDDVQMGWKKTKFTNIHDSDDECNRPKEEAMVNSSCKKRANNGTASDSQSVYAKVRIPQCTVKEERINERLRILQSLVPNGTKVDISTMLEEAVQYVKFLQLQIKLLSSDELWMYAPLAYNGMNIGLLDVNLPSPR
ncbi:hypothetical protein LXL04_038495 [Taraxacum kok-saghyz]